MRASAIADAGLPLLCALLSLCALSASGCREERGRCSGDPGRLCVQAELTQTSGAQLPDALLAEVLTDKMQHLKGPLSDVGPAFSARGHYTLEIDLTTAPGAGRFDVTLTAQLSGQTIATGMGTWHPGETLPLVVKLVPVSFPPGTDLTTPPDLTGAPPPDLAPPWPSGLSALTGSLGGGLSNPYDVCWNGTLLFVSDSGNSRVLVYNNPFATLNAGGTAMPANIIGAPGAPTATSLNLPKGLWCDADSLLVADSGNNRVLFYYMKNTSNGPPADGVIGQAGPTVKLPNRGMATATADGLNGPAGVYWDRRTDALPARLYIADYTNNRVVGYPAANITQMKMLNSQPAAVVFGQKTMTERGTGLVDGLNAPAGVTVDGTRLGVADSGNNRVAVYDVPQSFTAGTALSINAAMGQGDTMSSGHDASKSGLYVPSQVRVFGAETFIADTLNNRVVISEQRLPLSMMKAMDAVAVLGQSGFGQSTAGGGLSGLKAPNGLYLVPIDGAVYLLVADTGNVNRVQVFRQP